MKINFDIKNKKAGLEADVEKIVEKGMENHKEEWKDKFNTKYTAKKEMLEMKHKHKMEFEEKKHNKKNWIQKIQEDKLKKKELELEAIRLKDEEKKKILKIKIIASVALGIIGITMMSVGGLLGAASGDPNSGWHMISVIGLFPLISVGFVWTSDSDKKRNLFDK